ncbi:Hypothetical predicted protein [Cloeon dipterum]|uniref:Gastrin/cholecystokinin type B receptor n=1 Tax=Cloeon dipterum TaxID=197152 RepID=A0A8S1DX85_9INSE|nr:Hypothetical predicted protein [Cloeon dipterum]
MVRCAPLAQIGGASGLQERHPRQCDSTLAFGSIASQDSCETVDVSDWNAVERVNESVEHNWTAKVFPARAAPSFWEAGRVQIPLYSLIFLLAVVGNVLVILTLVQNQRMRTITNVFLLNLAVSDLLLGVFCMPFTLIGALLRDFVFGELMCKLIPYSQAVSVSVSVWTLVAISVERYYAICHPLRSRHWQTLSHAYRLIAAVWLGSFVLMTPVATLSELQPTSQGHHKCREKWPHLDYERAYNLLLDAALLVVPLIALTATYVLISRTLWRGMKAEARYSNKDGNLEVYMGLNGTPLTRRQSSLRASTRGRPRALQQEHLNGSNLLRRTNAEKSLMSKKRVIQMLFVVVLEFFLCWTPLYVINTIALFDNMAVYSGLGYTGISFFQLLAYSSSCCNPITYCFMNASFRKSFLNVFGCRRGSSSESRMNASGGSPCEPRRNASIRQRQGVLLCSWMEAAESVKRRDTQRLDSDDDRNGSSSSHRDVSIATGQL